MFFSITTYNSLTTGGKVKACASSIFAFLYFTSLLRFTFAVLQKPCQKSFGKLQGSGERRFDCSKKDRYFLKIPKWQHDDDDDDDDDDELFLWYG